MEQCAAVRAFLLLLSLSLATPALAADRAEQAAVDAAEVHQRYCADTYNQDIGEAGSSIAAVSEIWASMSDLPESTGETGLLYWRGLLAECLSRSDHAVADLQRFVELHGGDPTWAQPVRDAERRLARLRGGPTPSNNKPEPSRLVAVGAGIAAGVAGGVFGGLSGLRAGHAAGFDETYHSGNLTTSQFAAVDALGADAARDANALAAAGVAAGITSIATLLSAALVPRASPQRERGPSFSALPVPGGAWLGVSGRW